MLRRLLVLGALACAWPKQAIAGDNFAGQQIVVFGTSLSDNGNGVHPYMAQTLGLVKQVHFLSIGPPEGVPR
jgi:hypothetical protein